MVSATFKQASKAALAGVDDSNLDTSSGNPDEIGPKRKRKEKFFWESSDSDSEGENEAKSRGRNKRKTQIEYDSEEEIRTETIPSASDIRSQVQEIMKRSKLKQIEKKNKKIDAGGKTP